MTLAPPAMAATREALGPTLVRLREEGLDIVVVDADLGVSPPPPASSRLPSRSASSLWVSLSRT